MSALNKINKKASEPSEIELLVAQALYDLETSTPDLKEELRPLYITAAREVEVGSGRKAVVIFVPCPLLKAFHRIQARYGNAFEIC